ncbi:MAG TPA: acyltransferase [Thermoanaerobaculia bacterium]|jgi:acetyltransferase-like isoleucine patch superfamily enzyme
MTFDPQHLADVPPDFEEQEYNFTAASIAAMTRSGLSFWQRMLQVPRVDRFAAKRVKGFFREHRDAIIIPGFRCQFGRLLLGRNVYLCDAFLGDWAPIVMYDHVMFSWQNMLLTSTHDYENDMRRVTAKPIVLERNVWITTRCTILGGVRIGENTVVAAGSVVTKSLPPNVLAGGNPAKPLKDIKRKAPVE